MDFVPQTEEELRQMLREIGVDSFEDLLTQIPPDVRCSPMKLPQGISESELVARLRQLAARNVSLSHRSCFLGAGAYDHFIPEVVRDLSSRAEFYTAYTPYQPEASQGFLQAMFEYQTAICELTAMDVTNASLYDGASALAEAALMAVRTKPLQNPRLPRRASRIPSSPANLSPRRRGDARGGSVRKRCDVALGDGGAN